MRRLKRGQSTLEYLIILAVIVGAIVAAAVLFRPKLENSYNGIRKEMENLRYVPRT